MSDSPFLRGFLKELESGGEPDSFGYDHSVFAWMSAAERSQAEAALLDAAKGGDPKALETIGNLEFKSALPLLEEMADAPTPGNARAAARRSRLRLNPSPAATAAVADDLLHGAPFDRLLAASLLVERAEAGADEALLAALQDEDGLLRDIVWGGLLRRCGLSAPDPGADCGPLAALYLRFISSLKSTWHPAAQRAGKLFRRILAGEAATTVFPPYESGDPALRDRALTTLNAKGADPIDVSLIQGLSGQDRDWFEANLLSRIGDQDLRAIDAAAALRIKGVQGPLREALSAFGGSNPVILVAIRSALLFLNA